MTINEDHLRHNVFKLTGDTFDDLDQSYSSVDPQNLNDRFQIKNILDELNTAISNLANANVSQLSNIIQDIHRTFQSFLRVQGLLLQKVFYLEHQVAFQDKLL